MTEARYDEMLEELEAGETKFKEFLPDALKGEYNHVQIPEYKDKCLFCLLCNSWATKGDHSLLDAFVTKANILACPLFTRFCVHINFHPFSLSYGDGKSIGLDALTGDSQFSNELVGAYHSMVIGPLMTYINVTSTSSRTHSGEFERMHWEQSTKFLCLGKGIPHMEHLYNAKLAHSNWGLLKEIDMLGSTRELFIRAISSIIQNADGHSKFTEATVLKFLKGVVEDNPSCMRDPAYQIYVAKKGESYDGIKGIRSEISMKGVKAGGKAKAKATQDTRDEEFDKKCNDLIAYKEKFGDCNVKVIYPSLGSWCNNVRATYNRIQKGIKTIGDYDLSSDRIKRLEEIGFLWKVTVANDAAFEKRCRELIAFKEKFGHCNVPYSVNPSLRNWCKNIRTAYLYNKYLKGMETKCNLSQYRIERLNEIDFQWII